MRQVTLFVIWAVAVPAVAGGVIMALWNVLMPGLFGLAVISCLLYTSDAADEL